MQDRRLRAWVGTSSDVIAELFLLLRRSGALGSRRGATMDRLIWALYFLKAYPSNEEEGASRVGGVDEGTFRTWVWWFIEELSFLEPEVVCAAISYTSTTCSSHFSHKEYLLLFVVVLYRFDGRTGSRMTWEMIVLSQ